MSSSIKDISAEHNYAENVVTTDYLQGDVGFKRPKGWSSFLSPSFSTSNILFGQAQPKTDPDNSVGSTIMVIDDKTIVPRARDLESNFVDDEDLQATLARLRRVKILKTTKLTQQEIAAKVAAERARDKAEDETAGVLTFDDTSEFIRAIHYNPLEVVSEPAPPGDVNGTSGRNGRNRSWRSQS